MTRLRTQDQWAVRDTGTPAFYTELHAAFATTGVMEHCVTRATDRRAGKDWIAKQEERAALLRQGTTSKEAGGPGGRDMVIFVKAAAGINGAAGATCESVRRQLPSV